MLQYSEYWTFYVGPLSQCTTQVTLAQERAIARVRMLGAKLRVSRHPRSFCTNSSDGVVQNEPDAPSLEPAVRMRFRFGRGGTA